MTNSYTNVRPEIYQFNLGKFRITNILDGYFHREDMHPFTATNASAPEIEKIAKQHFLPFPKLEHNFVPTLVETSDALIAFDPGFGKRAPGPSAGWYNRLLEKTGWKIIAREKWTNPNSSFGIRTLLRYFTTRYYIVFAEKNKQEN